MATWILKTEPGDYCWDDLKADKTTVWDGVTSNVALSKIRNVAKGDEAWIYHTGKERTLVGLARVTSGAYPDPKADNEKLLVFDIKIGRAVKTPVTLADIKADDRFADFALVRQGRLSVVPVPDDLDAILREWTGLAR